MPPTICRPPVRRDNERRAFSAERSNPGFSRYHREKRTRQLNLKLAVISLGLVLSGIPAVYYWHQYQTNQLSAALWKYGELKAAEENWREASAAFYRVWEIRQDPALLGDAVKAYDKLAAKTDRPGVIAAYQRAIGGLPDQPELRVRLAELLMLEKQYQSARGQAEKVLSQQPDNLSARNCRALSLLGMFRNRQPLDDINVLRELERVYADKRNDLDLAMALVTHIRDDLRAVNGSDLAKQADLIVNRIVALQPQNLNTRLLRYQYRLKYHLPGAQHDLDQATLLAPNNPHIVKEAAVRALRDAKQQWSFGNYLSARELFKKLIALQPQDEAGYLGLGDTEFLVQADADQAVAVWQEGRRHAGDSLALLLRIAEGQSAAFQYEDLQQTLADVDEFVQSMTDPKNEQDRQCALASVCLFRGTMRVVQNRPSEAIAYLTQATEVGTGRSDNALRASQQSIAFAAWSHLGIAYRELGRWKDAADAFDQALLLDPEDEAALLASAEIAVSQNNPRRTEQLLERALQRSNPSPQTHLVRARYLFEGNRRSCAEALKTAQSKIAQSQELRLLEAEFAVRQVANQERSVDETLGLLFLLERDFSDYPNVLQRLPQLYHTLGLDGENSQQRFQGLSEKLAQHPQEPPSERMQAIVHLHRETTEDLAIAEQILDTLVEAGTVSGENTRSSESPAAWPEGIDYLLLAHCLERRGDFQAAAEQMEQVVAHDSSAHHLSVWIDLLLRDSQYDKARGGIDRLEQQTGWEAQTVLLRARWMVGTERSTAVRPYVEKFAIERLRKNIRHPAREMQAVIEIYEQIGFGEDAQRWREKRETGFPDSAEWSSTVAL